MFPFNLLDHFCRPILALALAGSTYLAETITPDIPGVPAWVSALGLPIAFLVAVIYALIATNRALRESEAGRRNDWAEYAKKIEVIMEKGNESRERLIRATDAQTSEFKTLADKISHMHLER